MSEVVPKSFVNVPFDETDWSEILILLYNLENKFHTWL